jgi:hypothetical protein
MPILSSERHGEPPRTFILYFLTYFCQRAPQSGNFKYVFCRQAVKPNAKGRGYSILARAEDMQCTCVQEFPVFSVICDASVVKP